MRPAITANRTTPQGRRSAAWVVRPRVETGEGLVPRGRDPPEGREPEGRRLRFFATRRRYGLTEAKSKVDGIGSGSWSAVPYVTTMTL